MIYNFHPLGSDIFLYIVILVTGYLLYRLRTKYIFISACNDLKSNRLAIVSFMMLMTFFGIGLLDSLHFKVENSKNIEAPQYSQNIVSLLDIILYPVGSEYEKTYSSPLSIYSKVKEIFESESGEFLYSYQRLEHSGNHIVHEKHIAWDVISSILWACLKGLLLTIVFLTIYIFYRTFRYNMTFTSVFNKIYSDNDSSLIRYVFLIGLILTCIILCIKDLSSLYHICGTDKVGQDVFYQTIKSVRTGFLIGVLTLSIMLPIAVILGIMSGFFFWSSRRYHSIYIYNY